MIAADTRLVAIADAIKKFLPATAVWARAARVERCDIEQAIAKAVLDNEDPAVAVPREFSIRRVGERWLAIDPVVHCVEYNSELHDRAADENHKAELEQDADNIDEVMSRAGIGRRAAQYRVKKQLLALQKQGDLFAVS